MFRPIDAFNVLCAQLTRDLFAIAKFLFLLSGRKWVFRPARATRCPYKREIWHSAPRAKFHLYRGRNVGIAPKTVKISNFGHKFVPRGRLVCSIFPKFSAFVRVHR